MSTSQQPRRNDSAPSGTSGQFGTKKILAGLGALILAGAGAYFGIDTGSAGNSNNTKSSSASATAPTSTNRAKPTPSNSTQSDTKTASQSDGSQKGPTRQGQCSVHTLPKEADDVIERILSDQDQLYSQHDGKHFGNYQNRLPRQRGDYYREYTVKTPGQSDRGARRIVVGGGTETDPDVWYYTNDHYDSFCQIPDAEH